MANAKQSAAKQPVGWLVPLLIAGSLAGLVILLFFAFGSPFEEDSMFLLTFRLLTMIAGPIGLVVQTVVLLASRHRRLRGKLLWMFWLTCTLIGAAFWTILADTM